MKALHCPNCGTPFVRVTSQSGILERVLHQLNVFPFRCQLCMNKFRAFHRGAGQSTQAFDRRQYKRLPTSIEAQFLADNCLHSTNRITDISMDGCTLQTTGLPRGTFLGLVLKPDQEDEAIRIETAMVCSVRPTSVGLRFLEIPLPDQRRLSQVVLGLLVGQGPPSEQRLA
jgi:PilZ domain